MTQEVTPSQAARDAAAPLCEQKFGEAVLRGEKDGWPIVQAFARFEEQTRTATEAATIERCAAIADAEGDEWADAMLPCGEQAAACRDVAKAIRALSEQKS